MDPQNTLESNTNHNEYRILSDNTQQDEEIRIIQDQLIQHISRLKDNHHQDDIQWFQKLIHNNHHDIQTEDIDLGILYNFTFLDSVVAKLLKIDLKKIISIEITKKYIRELWKDNSQQIDFLNSHILNNPNNRNFIEKTLRPNNTSEPIEILPQQGNNNVETLQSQQKEIQ